VCVCVCVSVCVKLVCHVKGRVHIKNIWKQITEETVYTYEELNNRKPENFVIRRSTICTLTKIS
jgi:hypothetical protein